MSKSTEERMKMIDRIIRAYQAKKLMLKAQEIQQDNVDEGKKSDLSTRMVQGYNKNRDQIEKRPKRPEVPQNERRRLKILDLLSRSSSWRNLT